MKRNLASRQSKRKVVGLALFFFVLAVLLFGPASWFGLEAPLVEDPTPTSQWSLPERIVTACQTGVLSFWQCQKSAVRPRATASRKE